MVKINRRILIPLAIVIIFVFVWTYFFWYPGYIMDQKIDELKTEDVDVGIIEYTKYHEDITATNPTAVFAEQVDWSGFKQKIMEVKESKGSVLVSVDLDQRIFVLNFDETTHYYYQV